MDDKIQIQLGSEKNINSTTVDTYGKVSLSNKKNQLTEYNIRNVLSVTEVFDRERNATEIYRIYGKINWLSLLHNLNNSYKYIEDFFSGRSSNGKTLIDSFNFYLLRPYTGYTKITNDSITYIRQFEVIATNDQIDIYNAGFDKNIFNDQNYGFNFNIDIDISNYLGEFDFPITELYLYPVYQRTQNGLGMMEKMYKYTWDVVTGDKSKTPIFPSSIINVGDIIYGDKIEYSKSSFLQVLVEQQKYFISTNYSDASAGSKWLEWEYNPFIPLRLRYFGDETKKANTGTTSYDQKIDIPYYATDLGNGNLVWRDILPQGYIDPITGNGVDYPFVNSRRYLFSNIVLETVPNLNDDWTLNKFKDLKFGEPLTLNYKPIGDINNIGKPCQ